MLRNKRLQQVINAIGNHFPVAAGSRPSNLAVNIFRAASFA
jgi:hypothetical protein